MRPWIAVILLLPPSAAAAADGTIITAANASLDAKEVALARRGEELVVTYVDPSGARGSLPAAEVVEIALGAAPAEADLPPGAEDIEVVLTTGDVLAGKAGARADGGVQVTNKAYGTLTVKFEHVRAVLFPANRRFLPKPPPSNPPADVVAGISGDSAEGTILGVSAGGVEYKSARLGREVTIPPAQAAGVWLAEMKAPPAEPASLFSIVLTAEGSSLRGHIRSLEGGILDFADLYGDAHKVPADQVAGLTMKNGRVVYLSDIDPAGIQEDANYIRSAEKQPGDLEYPFRRDRSAGDTRILLGGAVHRKGLGVHARSSLAYALGGAFRRFQATFGLDAVSGGRGAVTAEVWVDGKKVQEVTLKGADAPRPLDIEISSAKELRLVVTWAGNGQSDFADWGSARLIR